MSNFTPSQLIPRDRIDAAYDKLATKLAAANARIAELEAERNEQRANFHAAATYVQDLESSLAELRAGEKNLAMRAQELVTVLEKVLVALDKGQTTTRAMVEGALRKGGGNATDPGVIALVREKEGKQ